MSDRIVPQAFSPGEFIQDSLDARGWKQIDLANIVGVAQSVVNNWVTGKRRITAKTAQALADAFGNDPEEWVKLQAVYDITIRTLRRDDLRVKRSMLWHRVPMRHVIDRGWILESENVETLEAEVLDFYKVKNIEDIKPKAYAARKSTDGSDLTNEQLAWYRRAKNIAECLPIQVKYKRSTFQQLLDELEPLRIEPEEARKVPEVLRQHGIRFIVIEHLPGSKIDGICFWVGTKQDEPVIVLSMRYDRIDWFWFTLMHELAHVYHNHGKDHASLDMSLVGADAQPSAEKSTEEKLADNFASEYLIGQQDIEEFIGRISPLYSDTQIRGFADSYNVHPGIVIGRLQLMNRIPYSRGRGMLVKIRECVIQSALTDGWGNSIEI